MSAFKQLITDLQATEAAYIQASELFTGPPVLPLLTENLGDLANQVASSLKKMSLCILLSTPVIDPTEYPEIELTQTIQVTEIVSTNRAYPGTRIPAPDIALHLVGLLWTWQPGPLWSPLQFERQHMVNASPLIYEVVFKTRILIQIESNQTENGGNE